MGWREEKRGVGRLVKVRIRIRIRILVEREIRGYFIKERWYLVIDWVEKECYEEELKMDLIFYVWVNKRILVLLIEIG